MITKNDFDFKKKNANIYVEIKVGHHWSTQIGFVGSSLQ